jgi:hypothetical protein
MATYVMDTALDAGADADERQARRCGAFRTSQVAKRTTLLLTRFRYHITTQRGGQEYPMLAEDSQVIAFEGAPGEHSWIDNEAAEQLLAATPDANIHPQQAEQFLQRAIDSFEALWPDLDIYAEQRGQELLEAHQRVRTAAKMQGVRYKVEPQLPPDVLGIYIYLPAGGS